MAEEGSTRPEALHRQRGHLHVGGLDRQRAQHEIEPAVAQSDQERLGRVHLHGHLDSGKAAMEAHEGPRQDVGGRGVGHAEAKHPSGDAADLLDFEAARLHRGQRAPRLAGQRAAGFGEIHAAASTMEEGGAEILLQRLDLQAHRGLGEVTELARRRRDFPLPPPRAGS